MDYKHYVKLLKNKNETAFEAIYHETKHAVYAMVLPIVKDRSLAEDVMQETYTKMVEKIYSYDTKRSFMTWLLSIAKYAALDTIRNRRDLLMDHTENDDLFISKTSSVEKQLESEYFLSLLSNKERRIVLLKIVGDLKHKEIAELLDIPPGTVRYMYTEALKKMRQSEKGETS